MARPERIFNLLTEPAELAKWWGPRGFTIPDIRLDLRAGGGYRFTMQLGYTFRWDEPTPDDRETVVILTLSALDEATRSTGPRC